MPSKSNKQKRNYKRRTPKSKNSKGTNKKSMYNRLKRRNTKKTQKGGVNIRDLYKLKDELFMLLVLDIVDFEDEYTKKNDDTYSIKLFNSDKFKNNTTKTGKSCSNFTTFLYLIKYLSNIGYLKTNENEYLTENNGMELFIPNRKPEVANIKILVKEYIKNQNDNNESVPQSALYANASTSNKRKYKIEEMKVIEYFKQKEIIPFFKELEKNSHNYDLSQLIELRKLYDLYLESIVHDYNYCDFFYHNIYLIRNTKQIQLNKTSYYGQYFDKFVIEGVNGSYKLEMKCNIQPKITLGSKHESNNSGSMSRSISSEHSNSKSNIKARLEQFLSEKTSERNITPDKSKLYQDIEDNITRNDLIVKFAYLVKHILDTINSNKKI